MKLQKKQEEEQAARRGGGRGHHRQSRRKHFPFACPARYVAFVLIFMPLLHHIRLSSRPRPLHSEKRWLKKIKCNQNNQALSAPLSAAFKTT